MAVETSDEFRGWLETQPREMRALIAARAAVRAFPIACHPETSDNHSETLALLTARAILTSGVAAKRPTPEVRTAAHAAADAADAAAGAAADADVTLDFENLLITEIWHVPAEPGWLQQALRSRSNLLDSGPEWAFWRDWYQGWLTGHHVDWDLQRRVALIDDAIWDAGPAAVAAEIERIREEFDRQNGSSEPRQPDFEPDSVERVLANKKIAATSTAYASVIIGEAIEAFHAETGWNEIPETFVPLAQMPRSLRSIGTILQLKEQSDETKQQLREEIGRLNAKVAKLEKELEALRSKGDPVFRDAVKKSLGDWKLWAAVIAGGWIVLGDVEGAQARLENIKSLRDEIFGEPPAPSPDITPFDEPTFDI